MRSVLLLLAFAASACAQLSSSRTWHFQLADGAYVSFISGESLAVEDNSRTSFVMPDLTGDARAYGNTIEHVIEERGQKVLGYSLRIEPAAEAAYVITMQPIAGAPFFARAPKPLRIADGQRAEIDLATSRDGHVKAVASLQVTRYARRRTDLPASEAEPQDLTLEALHLSVSDAQFFKNNVRIAENVGGATGNTLVAYLPGIGRIFFSLVPQKEFEFTKAAVIEDNRIMFDIGSDRYEIASGSSIIGQRGPWKMYMLRARDSGPCNERVDSSRPSVWAQTLTSESLNCPAQ